MKRPDPARVAEAYRRKLATRNKTAGEVRFIKDKGSDHNEWAWNQGPSEREITKDFVFNARYLKPLATVLRSALMALGHATSAHNRFVKIKSRNISPDGSLGGRGYIQKIPDMRRQIMNCVEVLSSLTDTIYDEMLAPHWNPDEDTLDPRDRDEVKEIVEDVEEIKDDPEGWAEDQEDDLDEEAEGGKRASSSRVASAYVRRIASMHELLAMSHQKLRIMAAQPVRLDELGAVSDDILWLANNFRAIRQALDSTENLHV
jgi:hypothetical protein